MPTHTTLSSQNNWLKNMYSITDWVLVCQAKAVNAVRKIEQRTPSLPLTFGKCLEQYCVPEDWHSLADDVLAAEKPWTVNTFVTRAKAILRRRWWNWCLLHPQLVTEKLIHPSRGMHHSLGGNSLDNSSPVLVSMLQWLIQNALCLPLFHSLDNSNDLPFPSQPRWGKCGPSRTACTTATTSGS